MKLKIFRSQEVKNKINPSIVVHLGQIHQRETFEWETGSLLIDHIARQFAVEH